MDVKLSGAVLGIGETPLVPLRNISPPSGLIYGKCEFLNPSGSVKDRSALNCLKHGFETGQITPDQLIVEMTSGNMGAGLAMICATIGQKFIAVMSEGNSSQRAAQMKMLGAEILLVPQVSGRPGEVTGDDLRAVEIAAKQFCADHQAYYVDQFNNPGCITAHYETTGPEIWHQSMGKIDAFVAALGTGGTFTGISKYLKEKIAAIRCFAVEPKSSSISSPAGTSNSRHIIQGTGYGYVSSLFENSMVDETIIVSDEEVLDWRKRLLCKEGLFVGFSSAANVCAAHKYLESVPSAIEPKRVTTILCDSGFKYPMVPSTKIRKGKV